MGTTQGRPPNVAPDPTVTTPSTTDAARGANCLHPATHGVEDGIPTTCGNHARKGMRPVRTTTPVCYLHNNTALRQTEVVSCLANCDFAVEKVEVDKARQIEMLYTISQGINRRNLQLGEAGMTVRLLFLFALELNMSDDEKIDYWTQVVDVAVRSGPGLLVHEVFKEARRQEEAMTWLKSINVNGLTAETERVFLTPRHIEGVESDGDTDKHKTVRGLVDGSPDDLSGDSAQNEAVPTSPTEHDLDCLVAALEQCSTYDEIVSETETLIGARRSGRITSRGRDNLEPTFQMNYDHDVVRKAAEIVGRRQVRLGYMADLKNRLRVPEEPSDGDGEEDAKDKDLPVFSIATAIEALAPVADSEGHESPEMSHLKRHGFFKTRCMPLWYVCLIEALAKMDGRQYRYLFKKATATRDFNNRWDVKRQLSDIHKDDVLYDMLTKPVTAMMKKLGLLDVVGGSADRKVGSCFILRSLAVAIAKPILQGMHADTTPYFDWGENFGFSSITAGSAGGEIHIYPGSFDGGMGSGQPVAVKLEPGETIVFSGLARHRGVSYPCENFRFFVSFAVAEAVEKADKDQVASSTNRLQDKSDPEGSVVLTFEQWEQQLNGSFA